MYFKTLVVMAVMAELGTQLPAILEMVVMAETVVMVAACIWLMERIQLWSTQRLN